MEADWDLHAVVRGFASIGNSHSTSHAAQKVDMREEEEQLKRDGFCSKNLAEELHELFTPYLLNPPQTGRSVQPTISSYLAALEASKFKQHKQWTTNNKASIPISAANSVPITSTTTSVAAPPPPHSQSTHKPKRRKFQLKNISHVRAEALSADAWAWRKYGQKPIKGSPYPRGYYKCSSSKTCFARKQVERNRSDPTMFIVTCTGEHNHPAPTRKNSLAGTTRNRHPILPVPLDETMPATSKPSFSSSMENMSPEDSVDDEVLQHINEMEGGDMNGNNLVSEMLEFFDMDVNDDFFDRLDEIEVTPINGSSFSDPILPSFTD